MRLGELFSKLSIIGFNPRTHAGCDFNNLFPDYIILQFQSTHPRRVRQALSKDNIMILDVSIHAPTQGATPQGLCPSKICLFQSTHPRRVRRPVAGGSADAGCFNPRTHAGCDIFLMTKAAFTGVFQSTHPRRVRHQSALERSEKAKFQSTHPRRVRPMYRQSRIAAFRFQSTHPRRVRPPAPVRDVSLSIVSIHAPTQGATINRQKSVADRVFQSTHPRRVRLLRPSRVAKMAVVSIHAPTQGATPVSVCTDFMGRFQSTHPRRVRQRR